jgi:hypothetical protein
MKPTTNYQTLVFTGEENKQSENISNFNVMLSRGWKEGVTSHQHTIGHMATFQLYW